MGVFFAGAEALQEGVEEDEGGQGGTGEGEGVADAVVGCDAGVEVEGVGNEAGDGLSFGGVFGEGAGEVVLLEGAVGSDEGADAGVDGSGDGDAVFYGAELADGEVLGEFGGGFDGFVAAAGDEPAIVGDIEEEVDSFFVFDGGGELSGDLGHDVFVADGDGEAVGFVVAGGVAEDGGLLAGGEGIVVIVGGETIEEVVKPGP